MANMTAVANSFDEYESPEPCDECRNTSYSECEPSQRSCFSISAGFKNGCPLCFHLFEGLKKCVAAKGAAEPTIVLSAIHSYQFTFKKESYSSPVEVRCGNVGFESFQLIFNVTKVEGKPDCS
jgi:hypothetical protein